jgi:hypothetical protein
MRHDFRMLLIPLLLASSLQARQQVPVLNDAVVQDSETGACNVLKDRIAELLLNTKKPDRYWFCDFTVTKNEYVRIVGLRSSQPRDDGATIYSNLRGWYAVARRSHAVLQWDLNEDRLVPETSRGWSDVPVVEDSEQAACDVLKTQLAGVLGVNGRPDPTWMCEFSSQMNEYLYLIALRSVSSRSAPLASAKLVGKFAVGKRSNVVLALDEARNRLVALRLPAGK